MSRIGKIRQLVHAGCDIYEEHGFLFAVREHIAWAIGRIYAHRQYHAYHKDLSEVTGLTGALPDGYELQVIDSAEVLGDLISDHYSFNPYVGAEIARNFLTIKGVGFMLFKEKKLAAESWILQGSAVGTFHTFCERLGSPEDLIFMDGVETYGSHRRCGLQHYLMNRIFNYAIRRGLKEVIMIVKPHTVRGRLLWESLGAVVVEELDQVMVFGKCRSLTNRVYTKREITNARRTGDAA